MKTLLKLSVLALIVILIAIGCQKITSNENSINSDSGKEFNAAFAKEWYYASFKKSAEWKSSPLQGKKLPDWKNGIYHKIGKMEIIEFPLGKAVTQLGIPSNNALSAAQKQRIANASLTRVLFIKNSNGNIVVREIDYIPDWEYLQSKKFDISTVSYGKKDDDFTGKMIVKNWAGSILSLKLLSKGQITHSGKSIRNNSKSGGNNTSNIEECTTYEFCIWQQDCVITIIGDASETVCGEWYNTGDCWTEEFCNEDPCGNMTEEECACMVFGNCGGGGEDPCNGEETCESKDAKVNNSFENGIVGSDPSTAIYGSIGIIDSRDKAGLVTRQTWKGVGWFSSFILKATFNCTYTLKTGINSHSLNIGDYKWKSCNFVTFEKSGAPFGYTIDATYIESPYQIDENSMYIFPSLKYQLEIIYGCCGFAQPQYKTITDDLVLSIKL